MLHQENICSEHNLLCTIANTFSWSWPWLLIAFACLLPKVFTLFLKILLSMRKMLLPRAENCLQELQYWGINAPFLHASMYIYIPIHPKQSAQYVCYLCVFRIDHLVLDGQLVCSFLGKTFSHSQHPLVASSSLCRVKDSSLAFLLSLFSSCLSSQVGETYGCSL